MSNMNKRLAGNNSNSEQQPSVASDESGSTNSNPEEAKCVGRKRTIDESILEADELRKLESRRAYNRQCAAKARKRSKDLVENLQTQVDNLTKDKAELKRSNELMRVRLDLLEQQNHSLMMNQLANQSMAAAAAAAGQMGGRQQLGGLAGSVASFLGQDGTATGSWSLLDRLTIERAAAQNRIQALLQQQQQSLAASNSSSMGNIKSSSDVSDSARAYPG